MFSLTYRDLDSPVHRLGISTKAALFGSLCILSLIYSDLIFLVSVIATCLILARLGYVESTTGKLLRAFLFFSLIVFLINLMANQHGENSIFRTSFRFYFWRINFRITLESLSSALQMVFRLLAVILSFLVFTLTTKPEALLARFSGIRGMEGFGLLLGLAYRFLPTLVSDGVEIRDSLRTRGIQFDEGGRLDRARSYTSLGIPLVVNGLDRSLQLAEAMESRGYGSGRRWSAQPLAGSRFDILLTSYYLIIGGILCCMWLFLGVGSAVLFTFQSHMPLALALVVLFIAPVFILWRLGR